MAFRRNAGDEFDTRIDNANSTTKTSDGVAGNWVELVAAGAGRNWLGVQNQDDTAVIYILAASTTPASGTQAGEFKILANQFYDFDFNVRMRWFFRSSGTSTKAGVWNA